MHKKDWDKVAEEFKKGVLKSAATYYRDKHSEAIKRGIAAAKAKKNKK